MVDNRQVMCGLIDTINQKNRQLEAYIAYAEECKRKFEEMEKKYLNQKKKYLNLKANIEYLMEED